MWQSACCSRSRTMSAMKLCMLSMCHLIWSSSTNKKLIPKRRKNTKRKSSLTKITSFLTKCRFNFLRFVKLFIRFHKLQPFCSMCRWWEETGRESAGKPQPDFQALSSPSPAKDLNELSSDELNELFEAN